MDGPFEALRDGTWLTRERMRLWAGTALIAAAAGVLYLVVTAQGAIDAFGRPLGTDFSNVYAAGRAVLEGRPELPFDAPAHYAHEKMLFGRATPFYGWHYPPFFLFIAALLAMLPYLPALIVWQGATLALYLIAIRHIVSGRLPLKGGGRSRSDREGVESRSGSPPGAQSAPTSPLQGEVRSSNLWLLLAVGYPAVFINLGHGHNGFLTAALMGWALAVLDRRPVLAGILFGLLAYKPQFGLLIPLVLIATGRWRSFIAAAVTVALLALAATLAFGSNIWPAFLTSTDFTREVVLEAGDTGWHKIQSVFSWVRLWGGPVAAAYAVQAAATLVLAAATIWLWRSAANFYVKAAGLIIASLLATPYSLDYDLMVLAPAIAFLAADGLAYGFRPWEKTVLALLWIVPLIARSFTELTSIPLAVPLMCVALAVVLRRAMNEAQARSAVTS